MYRKPLDPNCKGNRRDTVALKATCINNVKLKIRLGPMRPQNLRLGCMRPAGLGLDIVALRINVRSEPHLVRSSFKWGS